MELETPIEEVSRISLPYQKKLAKLGIKTVKDLLFHFPHRYEDFSKITSIGETRLNELVCIKGKILEIGNRRTPRKKIILTEAIVQDNTGTIKVVWFNQPYLIKTLRKGEEIYLAGKILLGESGSYLSAPTHEKNNRGILIHTGRIVPIYPETEGLSSRWLRYILKFILANCERKVGEPFPPKILKEHHLLPATKASRQIHFPDSIHLAEEARRRFAFEEIFVISLFVLKERGRIAKEKGIPIPMRLDVVKSFINSLPFELTRPQKKGLWQILKDLEKERPMNRLLEGDVGSGKTVVALISALNVVTANYQVAFMVPTEILAKQHFQTLARFWHNFDFRIGLITGKENKIFCGNSSSKIPKKQILEKLKSGEIDILIGTHSLIQESVKFRRLALVILDEQHRFGVEQRAKLILGEGNGDFRKIPHLLSMTATPIPRTLSLTIYGELDLSVIDELPKGRKKIITRIILPKEREKTYDFIRKQVKKRRQVFVICPRIEKNNKQQRVKNKKTGPGWEEVKAVSEEYKKLSEEVFPDLKIAMLHGRMKSREKEKIMDDFKNKKLNILVSTSVIEVGIDIPNATVMMIEGAERFGLSQLHQFRGRVGRAKFQSFCFLFTESSARKTWLRLKALVRSQDGFELAEKDLKIRGPGDFFGNRQWGIPDLAMSYLKDLSLVKKARKAARQILTEDWRLKKYFLLQQRLNKFRERVHLE